MPAPQKTPGLSFKGGEVSLWRDTLDLFVNYAVEKESSCFLKVNAVTRKNALLKGEVTDLGNTDRDVPKFPNTEPSCEKSRKSAVFTVFLRPNLENILGWPNA